MVMNGCKIINNIAAPFLYGTGDGILFHGGTLTIKNSVINGNSGIGIHFESGTLTLDHSSVRGNGTGIHDLATQHHLGKLNIIASIISENADYQILAQ